MEEWMCNKDVEKVSVDNILRKFAVMQIWKRMRIMITDLDRKIKWGKGKEIVIRDWDAGDYILEVHIIGMDEWSGIEEKTVRGGKAKEPKAKCMLTLLGIITGVEWIEDIELGGQSVVMRGWRMTPVKKRREYVVLRGCWRRKEQIWFGCWSGEHLPCLLPLRNM